MGGIPTNVHGQVLTQQTDGSDKVVEGLYAAGELCVFRAWRKPSWR